jgi:hypothetical protein
VWTVALLPEPCRARSVGFILPGLRGNGLGVMYVGFDMLKSEGGRVGRRSGEILRGGFSFVDMDRRNDIPALLLSP